MKQLNPYLMFPGTCREALEFYASCLGGEITKMQTVGESPMDMPGAFQDRIFDAAMQAEGVLIRASDDQPGHEVTAGSNFALFVMFDDSAEQQQVFDKLAEGGRILFPLANGFGMVADKYQIQWMLAGAA